MVEDQMTLTVGGREYGGWKTISLTRGIDALVGQFSIALSERWPGQVTSWGIEAGDACQIYIGGDLVLTGYIDQASYSIDGRRHPVQVTGSEKSCDLVDCSAIHTPASWKKRSLEQIASDLAKPFGIGVKAVAATAPAFPTFALQQGETVFDVIDRMAKLRGVLPVTTAAGDVELILPGKTPAGYTLEQGVNLEAISFDNDVSKRFSEYLVKGYSSDGKTRPKATAKDGGVGRYRPLLIVSDDASTPASLKTRATYEASVRAGRGQQITAIVSGWRSADGQLYRADRLVTVKAPIVGIDTSLLLYSVTYTADDSGRSSELKLAPKEAFGQEPIAEPPKRRRASTPPPGAK